MNEGDGGNDAIDTAIAGLAAARQALFEIDLAALSVQQLLEVTRRIEQDRRIAEALDQRLVAHFLERGVATELAMPTTTALLSTLLLLSPREAARRVRAATDLGPRRAITGEQLAPTFAVTAAAQRNGSISPEHASVITGMIKRLPDPIRDEHGEAAEATLVEHARVCGPAQLASLGRRISAHLDPDGIEPDENEKQRRRDVTIGRNQDGSGFLAGTLTSECLAMLQAAIDPLAAPCPAAPGASDTRSVGQRRHDALQELARRMLADGGLPDTGGTPTTLLVTMSLTDLLDRTGYATTGHGGDIGVAAALKLAADAEVIPVVLTDSGGVLCYGRTKRLAPACQRRAMAARDKGCSFPNCDRPPAWCQTHHVPGWTEHGQTDIDKMTLVCEFHHFNHERVGWECEMINGVPHWRPPSWIDPDRRPVRNTAHDIQLLDETHSRARMTLSSAMGAPPDTG